MNNETLPEPVLIDFADQHWHHPDIESLLTWEVDGINPGRWSYDHLYRVYLENPDGKIASVVVHWPEVSWEDIAKSELTELLPVVLFEDVWMPGGEQFCFTDIGQDLSRRFFDHRITFISPDVGIESDESGYHWSS
jgi:hypothetical protein